jgi:hypothetical protein
MYLDHFDTFIWKLLELHNAEYVTHCFVSILHLIYIFPIQLLIWKSCDCMRTRLQADHILETRDQHRFDAV